MLNSKIINHKTALLFISSLIFSYFEIIFFDIDHFLLIEDDLKRLGFYLKIQPTDLLIIYFPFIFLIASLTNFYLGKITNNKFFIFFVLIILKISIFTFLFYFLRIYTISRLKIFVSTIIFALLFTFLLIFLKKSFRNSVGFLCFFGLFFYLIIVFDIRYEVNFNSCINSFSENNILSTFADPDESIYVIGHAYGSKETATIGMSDKVTKYINDNIQNQNSTLVLTGDIVYESTMESLLKVKQDINNNFGNYLIAVGNHEVQDNNNYYKVFDKDLFLLKKNNTLFIAANFSTKNWLPTKYQQNKINNFLEINKNIDTVFLFSHQLFWQLDVDSEIQPNGMNLLEDNLIRNSTEWLNLNEKKLIVISGDYGANGQESYCKKLGNTIFVANGIGDKKNDTIIQIYMNDEGFYILKKKL